MNTHPTFRPTFRHRFNAMTVMGALLLFALASSLTWSNLAGAQAVRIVPTLMPASIVAPPSGLVAIRGEGFSLGGLVDIAVFDQGGERMGQHVWTVASTAVHGPNGSADPARGYAEAGSIDALVPLFAPATYGPNGSQDPAQGYRNAAVAEHPVYGPNGSQDPAQGYERNDRSSAGACGQDLIARGYDARTATWSNPVDIVADC